MSDEKSTYIALYKLMICSLQYKQGLFYNFLKQGLYDPRMLCNITECFYNTTEAFGLICKLSDFYLLDRYMELGFQAQFDLDFQGYVPHIFVDGNYLYIHTCKKMYKVDVEPIEDTKLVDSKIYREGNNSIFYSPDFCYKNKHLVDWMYVEASSDTPSRHNGIVIRIRDATTREIVATSDLQIQNNDNITSLSYSKDGKYIASGWGHGLICIWSADTLAKLHTITKTSDTTGIHMLFNNYYHLVQYTPDNYLCLANYSGTITVLECKTWSIVKTINTGQTGITAIQYSPDNKYLAVVYNSKIDMYDPQTLRYIYSIPLRYAYSVCFSEGSKYLFIALSDRVLIHKLRRRGIEDQPNRLSHQANQIE